MALESAQYVSQLVATNPLSTDSVSQADDHLRLIKLTLFNTFPNLSGPVTATQDQLNSPVPQGGIILWSGVISAIPPGYVICDGTNGTPDLRNNFVMGAGSGSSYSAPLATGGSSTSGPGGTHTHTVNNGNAALTQTSLAVAAGVGATALATDADTGHSHSVNEVGDHYHSVTPPFVALAYIMKT